MPKLKKLIEPIFAVFVLFHYSQGAIPLVLTRGASEGDRITAPFDYSLNIVIFFSIYIITSLLLLARWKKVIRIVQRDIWLWLVVGLAFASIFWSSNPNATLVSSVAFLGTTLFGLYLATRYTMREQLILLAWMYGISLVLSILFAVLPPHYGIMGGVHTGAFRGIYTHKNTFGKVMLPGIVSFILLALSLKRYRFLLWSLCALGLMLLILAKSTTSLVNVAVLIISTAIYSSFRWRYSSLIPALFALTVIGGSVTSLMLQDTDFLFSLIGKDASLTGRTDIWPLIIDMIHKRPWLGYGFGPRAFWDGLVGESAYVIRAAMWDVPDSHNGILDLWLALGFVGVSIFIVGYWACLVRSIAWLRSSASLEGLWPILYLTYLVLANLTESSLAVQNNLYWMLYSSVAFSLLSLPEQRLSSPKIDQSTHLMF